MTATDEAGRAQSTVNFTEAVRDGPLALKRAIVLTMLGLLVLFDGMDTQMLGVIAHDMTAALGLPLSSFGVVFSAALLGGVVGALILSPVADRLLGRKTVLVSSMFLAGVATLVTPFATNLTELLVIRFLAGLGLGAALPSIFSLSSEFSPKRYSRVITSFLIAFMPLGSLLVGVIGRAVVPAFGWEMLLYVGGVLTLLLTLLAAVILPESVYFLLRTKRDERRAVIAAKKLLPDLPVGKLVVDESDQAAEKRDPVSRLFTGGIWKFTLLIWIMAIMNQGILYFAMSWTPALLQKSGLAATVGMHSASTFGLGGALGTIAQGWLATRFNIYKVMLIEIALYVVAILALPFMLSDAVLAPTMVFFISAGIAAYHAGLILIVLESYPTNIRTTGLGWAFGIGRIGATSAPVLAGLLVGLGWSSGQIFAAASLPGIISASALLGIALLINRREKGGVFGRVSSAAASPGH